MSSVKLKQNNGIKMSNIWGDIFAILLLSLVASLTICTCYNKKRVQIKIICNQFARAWWHSQKNYFNDQTEMSQFRITCYCEMISICPRLTFSIYVFTCPSLPSLETSIYLTRMCGVSWQMICVPDVGIVDSVPLKLKYFLLVLIYGTVTRQVLHCNVLLFFLFTTHWDQKSKWNRNLLCG